MGKKYPKNIHDMGCKPRALGNNAIAIVDEAIMANQMCMNELVKIVNNSADNTTLKLAAQAIVEASKAQGKLTEVRYLGK